MMELLVLRLYHSAKIFGKASLLHTKTCQLENARNDTAFLKLNFAENIFVFKMGLRFQQLLNFISFFQTGVIHQGYHMNLEIF